MSAAEEQIVVITKCDLTSQTPATPGIPTSSLTGQGLDELRSALATKLSARMSGEVVPATALRCRDSLTRAATAIDRARHAAAAGAGEEFVAAELWLALDELGQIVGAVYTDDMLDRLFSRFCIGK
jgi:tRNA modification GTPase